MIAIGRRNYHRVECVDCKKSFTVHEEKDYLIQINVKSRNPVDGLNPLCSLCCYYHKVYAADYNALYVFNKVEL